MVEDGRCVEDPAGCLVGAVATDDAVQDQSGGGEPCTLGYAAAIAFASLQVGDVLRVHEEQNKCMVSTVQS